MQTMMAKDICDQALRKIGVVGQGAAANGYQLQDALFNLNLIIDSWNGEGGMMFNNNYHTFNVGSIKQAYTIGPGGDFDIPMRPMALEYAAFQQQSTPPLDLPMTIVSSTEWASIQIKGIASALGSVIYMNQDWPLGQVFIWPAPAINAKVVLTLWEPLNSNLLATTIFSLPPGYARGLMLDLAMNLAPNYGKQIPGDLAATMASIKNNIVCANVEPQRLRYDVPTGPGTYNSQNDQTGRTY